MNFNLLFTALGKPGQKLAAEWTGKLADALGGLAEWAETNEGLITTQAITTNPFLSSLQLIGETFKLGGIVIQWAGDQLGKFMEQLRPLSVQVRGRRDRPALRGALPTRVDAGSPSAEDRRGGRLCGSGARDRAPDGRRGALTGPHERPEGTQQAHADALKKHTQALDNHALALRQGTYGSGPRIRTAVPAKLGGNNLNRAAENGMLRQLEAFGF